MKRSGYIPRRKPLLSRKRAPTRKKTALWAQYGLKKPLYIRFEGLKGIYWWLLSRHIRKRDFIMWNGKCVSCGRTFDNWHDLQAGHFIAASKGGFDLLFDPSNLAAQCPPCNNPRISPNATYPFALELDRRYGAGTSQALFDRSGPKAKPTKEWNAREYDIHIRRLLSEGANDEL